MSDLGIGSWTARRARKTPDAVALVAGRRSWTYAELAQRCERLADGLAAHGVKPGDRVAYLGPNSPTFLESLFAVAALGAVFVPLNTRLAAQEMAFILADAGVTVVIQDPGTDLDLGPAVTVVVLPGISGVETPALGYEELLSGEHPIRTSSPVGADDVCMVMYTSGTTGRPKGATLTHANITWNCLNVLVDADFRADEVTLVTAPLFHTAALNMSALPTLLKGGRLVIEEAFDPDRAIELIENHQVTGLFGVPAMYAAISRSPRWATARLESVRSLMCGGAPVPESLIRTYLDRGFSFLQGYGMTETSPGALLLDEARSRTKVGSAGYPHFFTDVAVVRPDFTEVAVGERGEIVVRGPNVMAGYWHNPTATAAAMTEGWFHTGDVATVDDEGAVFVVDRLKDMIISGGENIYPAEVETALHEHPAVQDCAVVGVADARWGEVGRAYVVLAPGEELTLEGLRDFLTDRLARYKIPRDLVTLEGLPRNPSGKILRRQLPR